MLNIKLPRNGFSELSWVVSVLIGDRLGLSFAVEESGGDVISISFNGKALILPNSFFNRASDAWLEVASLPGFTLSCWDVSASGLDTALTSKNIPVLYGRPGFEIDSAGNAHLYLDVFGSTFFMLSRYEEVVIDGRDSHGRFPATASTAYKAGFLSRPIIDEYLEILWTAMKRMWPLLKRKEIKFKKVVSCDVDCPYFPSSNSVGKMLKSVSGDILKRGNVSSAFRTANTSLRFMLGDFKSDPNWRFDWMMNVSEKASLKCVFNFITVRRRHPKDCVGYWGDRIIDKLISSIHARGHEIGLHTSYTTYDDPAQTKAEFDRLLDRCKKLGVKQTQWGGRQHALHWRAPITWRNWNDAGLDYDSTLTYADVAGFRCGTCHPYPTFDLIDRKQLDLIERPLIVMDCTVFDRKYMGLGYENGLALIQRLKNACRLVNGNFTLLWHNSYFHTKEHEDIFGKLVEG